MSGRLQGKVAIVTGGSRGIGRAIVGHFLSEGASVATTSRKAPDDLPQDPNLLFLAADISKAAEVERLFAAALRRFGGLDILVNNAGLQLEKTIDQTSEEEFDLLIAVNLKGVFLCTKAALAPMRRRGGGSIINIGSYDAFVADPDLAVYCASKGGVHALTRAIAVDHGCDAIRCNTIAPGWIRTEMSEDYLASRPDPVAARRNLASIHPVGRIGEPRDIAECAVFLACDAASFISGQQFVVDGGLTARAPQAS
jgi:meso-butanediol dehydrogenase/(S,S)-butanediol dehydrogenase/diacetyl reductase